MTKKRAEMTPEESAKADAYAAARREARKAVPQAVIPDRHHVRGVSTLVDADGTVRAQWIKTAADKEDRAQVLERLLADLPTKVPRRPDPIPAAAHHAADLMSVYPLGDPHVGLLAWADASGANFDLEGCEALMCGAMRDLVLRGPRSERALIVNLGDFFHYDNAARSTTRGTPQDGDTRWPKVLRVGLRIFTTLIDTALMHHKLVDVDCRIGNHDEHSAIMLSVALESFYRNEPRVRIHPTVAHRAYYTFGECLFGTAHGERCKIEELGEVMAAEQPVAWGGSKHRVFFTGHVHHRKVLELRGVMVESFRTLAARDDWHAGQGYIAGRDMHRITYHSKHGEVGREIVNVGSLLA